MNDHRTAPETGQASTPGNGKEAKNAEDEEEEDAIIGRAGRHAPRPEEDSRAGTERHAPTHPKSDVPIASRHARKAQKRFQLIGNKGQGIFPTG